MASEETAAAQGPSAAQMKKKRNTARWGTIVGVVFAVAMVARAVDAFMPKELPHCDDVQGTVHGLMDQELVRLGATSKVKSLAQVQEGARTGAHAECKITVTLTDNERGLASYRIDRNKGQDVVMITGMKQL